MVSEVIIKDLAHIGTTVNLKRYVYDRVGNNYAEPLDNLDDFYDFATENFAVVYTENTIIGERRKIPKFSNESEVYEVVCSKQKTSHSLKRCFLEKFH